MLILSHQTALWLMVSPLSGQRIKMAIARRSNPAAVPSTTQPVPLTARQAAEIWRSADIAAPGAMGGMELHVLIREGTSRRATPGTVLHLCGALLPAGSLARISRQVTICTPELCFLQMAASLSTGELALLGMALCGCYWPACCQRGFLDARPLTTPCRIQRYLRCFARIQTPAGCRGLRGFGRAQRVARFLMANSLSPLESAAAILMHFPVSDGGYGLPSPALNPTVRLSPGAAQVMGRTTIRPDIRFAAAKLGIECQGHPYHLRPERDIRRELALGHDGDTVLSLAYEQLADAVQRDELMRRVSTALGRRPHATCRHPERRDALVSVLLPRPTGTDDNGNPVFPKPSWALPAQLLPEAHGHAYAETG